MQKIMFNDKYGLTDAVIKGTKTMTRRNSDRYEVGEVVAIAQSYRSIFEDESLKSFRISLAMERETDGRPQTEFIESAGYRNKMFIQAGYMPHHIKIISKKQEHIQDITDEDCLMEGVVKTENGYKYAENSPLYRSPKGAFQALIEKLNGKYYWLSNPTVYAYSFELVD